VATTDNIKYGTSTAITITLNSLASSQTVGRQATVIDNSSNLFDDVYVTIILSTAAGAPANDKAVYVYLSGSEDGTNFDQDDGAMGASDAGYTVNLPSNLKGPYPVNTPTASKVYNKTFNLRSFFGGIVPRKWTVVVVNYEGQTLAASGNSMSYTGITYTNA
jgi:hypothetical protein